MNQFNNNQAINNEEIEIPNTTISGALACSTAATVIAVRKSQLQI